MLIQETQKENKVETEVETGILRASVQCIAKFDLCLTAFKLTNVQQLTREDQKKRTEKGKRQLHYITLANSYKTFFVDKKIFKLKV